MRKIYSSHLDTRLETYSVKTSSGTFPSSSIPDILIILKSESYHKKYLLNKRNKKRESTLQNLYANY